MRTKLTGVIGAESEYYVTVVGHGDGVLWWWKVEFSVEESSPVQIKSVLQIDLLYVLVGWSAHTNNVEGITVQMERMGKIWLLYCRQKKRINDIVSLLKPRGHWLFELVFFSYLRLRERLRRPRCKVCQPCACTCSWLHNRRVYCHRCRIVPTEYRRSGIAAERVEKRRKSHRRVKLRDHR